MRPPSFPRRLPALLATIAFLTTAPLARADVIYNVTADVSALNAGTSGNLDFELNHGTGTFDGLTATITNFSSTNVVLGAPGSDGSGSGSLPGTLTIGNSGAFNDVYQAVTFGGANSHFSFTLTLTGAAVNSPSSTATAGTAFGLGILDSNFNPFPAFGNHDPVLLINVAAKNPVPVVTTVVTPPITNVSLVTPSVPEPSVTVLAGMGMAILVVVRRSRGSSRTEIA